MKYASLFILMAAATCSVAQAKSYSIQSENSLETKGTVERLLMNSQGDVDGFLLNDGTQVSVPPPMAAQLTSVIAPKDKVDVKGFRTNSRVFEAQSVFNRTTEKSVALTPLNESRQQLSAQGKIRTQLYGARGEVNGVILADGTIVRFGPGFLEKSDVKLDVGQSLRASGLGTKNNIGMALEASQMSNW